VYWSSNKEVLKRLLVHAEAYPIIGKKARWPYLELHTKDSRNWKYSEIIELRKLIYCFAPSRRLEEVDLNI
jgi:hypothetical protein